MDTVENRDRRRKEEEEDAIATRKRLRPLAVWIIEKCVNSHLEQKSLHEVFAELLWSKGK